MSKLGKTNNFPEGKIDASDEGELQMGIAADTARGIVMINFGTPVAWIGLLPHSARELATKIIKAALEVSRKPQ